MKIVIGRQEDRFYVKNPLGVGGFIVSPNGDENRNPVLCPYGTVLVRVGLKTNSNNSWPVRFADSTSKELIYIKIEQPDDLARIEKPLGKIVLNGSSYNRNDYTSFPVWSLYNMLTGKYLLMSWDLGIWVSNPRYATKTDKHSLFNWASVHDFPLI